MTVIEYTIQLIFCIVLHAPQGLASESRLRDRLSSILLRRTKEAVLTSLLPPRNEFVVHCGLTAAQQARYMAEARLLLTGVNHSTSGVLDIEADQPVSSSCLVGDESLAVIPLSASEGAQKVAYTGVLPHLMALRLCCDSSSIRSKNSDREGFSSTLNSAAPTSTSVVVQSEAEKLQLLFAHSAKLKVLANSTK